jgi:hypothetical protein
LGIVDIVEPMITVSDRLAASVININPINKRKDKPNICREGCLFTNRLTGSANPIIMVIAITTAAIMIHKAYGIPFVIPTAVRIESNEKTISIKTI